MPYTAPAPTTIPKPSPQDKATGTLLQAVYHLHEVDYDESASKAAFVNALDDVYKAAGIDVVTEFELGIGPGPNTNRQSEQ